MIKLTRMTVALTVLTVSLAAGCQSSGPEPNSQPGNVAILVLDQFSAKAPPSAAGTNCPYSGLPTNEVGSGGGGGGLPKDISHGTAVFDTVMEELAQQNLTQVAESPSIVHPQVQGDVEAWKHGTGNKIYVVRVDVADYDTQLMTENTRKLMQILHDSLQVTKFVLNMSFLVLPCDLGTWYDANQPNPPSAADMKAMIKAISRSLATVKEVDDFKDALDKFASLQNPTVELLLGDDRFIAIREVVLVNLVIARLFGDGQPIGGELYPQVYRTDPWNGFLREARTEVEVIPVGAAGNGVFPLGANALETVRFPFPPALWNSVVSVSAADEVQKGTADYSNSGEVMMTASNPYLADGTSFAAPHLSALAALYLLNGGNASCDGHIPVLGYADTDNQPRKLDWDDRWLNSGTGADLATGAATHVCKTFAELAN